MIGHISVHEKIKTIQKSFRYGLFMQRILTKLALKGIKFQPYYLVHEQLFEHLDNQFGDSFNKFSTGFLDREDMVFVSSSRDWNLPEKHYIKLLEDGKKCFGVKFKEELAAFMWLDLKKCNYLGEGFPLKTDEAYFYDAWTLEKFRGEKIASFMRYQCYKALNERGRKKFYSITEYFNTPAAKFKKRLGAKNIKVGLLIEIFEKYHWTFEIRRYD